MKSAEHRRLTPLLIAACVLVLLALLTLIWGVGRHVHWGDPSTALARLPTAQGATTLPPTPPLQHYADIWQRPLFSTDRRPSPIAFGDDASDASLGDLELTGIIITPSLRMAMLRNRKTGAEVRVREGEGVDSGRWTLQALAARSATFVGAGGRTLLPLKVAAHIDRSTPAANAPQAAGTSPGMRRVDTTPQTRPARVGRPGMGMQQSGSIRAPTPAQVKAGNAQKARVKALLQKRIEEQRQRQRQATQDGDH